MTIKDNINRLSGIFVFVLCAILLVVFTTVSVSAASEPVPGEKTLKNMLITGLEPMGSTLYVYGGAWNEEDTGSGVEAVTIGLTPDWRSYFLQNAPTYDYNDHRYEIHNGIDCSGYLGWIIYNTLETVSGKEGYVMSSTKMAERLSEKGWGTYIPNTEKRDFIPGDIVSINGHVWISLGQCSDGSVVLMHSTPNGGPQISGTVTPDGKKYSQAVQLAKRYLEKYFPYFYNVFGVKTCSTSYFEGNIFRWDVKKGVISDPEGLRTMSPEQVLNVIFEDRPAYKAYSDISSGQWFVDAAEYNILSGTMKGSEPGLFNPDGIVTRAQFAQVLYNKYGNTTPYTAKFSDVKKSAWYSTAVNWAAADGIMKGSTDKKFMPNDFMTREQMITALYRCLGNNADVNESVLHAYSDMNRISNYAVKAFAWGLSSGVIKGTSEDSLSPKDSTVRSQLAQMLYELS